MRWEALVVALALSPGNVGDVHAYILLSILSLQDILCIS